MAITVANVLTLSKCSLRRAQMIRYKTTSQTALLMVLCSYTLLCDANAVIEHRLSAVYTHVACQLTATLDSLEHS